MKAAAGVAPEARATEADIRACFRLLLGREPNAEEVAGHFGRAGEELGAVVGSYLDSLEFTRRKLTARRGVEPEVAAFEGFQLLAHRDDLAVGAEVLKGVYEPEVAAVFREVLRPGMGVVDIGANIGFFTMMAASLVGPGGRVLALEPNPANARMAEASRRLNGFGQVTVLQAAAGRGAGMLALNTSFSNGTTSALDEDGVLGAETVGCVAVDQVVPAGMRVGLIKADVEGAEYPALLGCQGVLARDRPLVVFEFSPGALPGISGIDGEGLLRWVVGQGYGLSVLQRDGAALEAGTDVGAVMRMFSARGADHVDVVARPRRRRWFR